MLHGTLAARWANTVRIHWSASPSLDTIHKHLHLGAIQYAQSILDCGKKLENLEENDEHGKTMQKSIQDGNQGSEPNPGAMSWQCHPHTAFIIPNISLQWNGRIDNS
ncbi:hypothetical protein AMELA_G00210680 [Ameiurus melas]|uniref:Uncharacterized protein n=1 Tax=Ameiurus melas TaxID=219545 RepID=A0A7J6A4I8_AMEME|nr:hypothetical protein AMELA_G00210680 [Ameiurus melas]